MKLQIAILITVAGLPVGGRAQEAEENPPGASVTNQATSAPSTNKKSLTKMLAPWLGCTKKAVPAKLSTQNSSANFRKNDTGRFEFHARNLDVTDALAQLRRLVKKNIVVAPGVDAQFSGDLYDLNLREMLDVIALNTGLQVHETEAYFYVESATLQVRVFRLNYARAQDLVVMITPMLAEGETVSGNQLAVKGITPSQEEAGGDDYAHSEVLVANAFPATLERIEKIVQALDVRPRQVLIEAVIISANLNSNCSLGIDYNALWGVDFEGLSSVSTGGTSITPGTVPLDQLNNSTTAVDTNLLNAIPTGGLNFGFIKNNIGVFIRALQQVTDTTVLANPKILCLNKQRGQVIIGRRDGYLTTTVTQTASIQEVEFLETGTRLLFRPYIGNDDFVRLEIHPEDSNGGVSDDGLPFKETAEVTTNIMMQSGETVVIGGLFRERGIETQNKIPLLGDIPLLGVLFRSTRKDSVRQEIIILLTPRIIDTENSDEKPTTSEGTKADCFTPKTRERLARVYFQSARAMLENGNLRGARAFLSSANKNKMATSSIQITQSEVCPLRLSDNAEQKVDKLVLDRIINEIMSKHPDKDLVDLQP